MSHQDSLTQLDPLTPATKREGEGEEETGEAVGEAEAAATAGAEAEVAVVEGAVVVAAAVAGVAIVVQIVVRLQQQLQLRQVPSQRLRQQQERRADSCSSHAGLSTASSTIPAGAVWLKVAPGL